jgi:hypothetical protein
MAAAARNPAFAKKLGIPPGVAREFSKADAKTGILRKKRKPDGTRKLVGSEDIRRGKVSRG